MIQACISKNYYFKRFDSESSIQVIHIDIFYKKFTIQENHSKIIQGRHILKSAVMFIKNQIWN